MTRAAWYGALAAVWVVGNMANALHLPVNVRLLSLGSMLSGVVAGYAIAVSGRRRRESV